MNRIIELATKTLTVVKPHAITFVKYAKVELIPPTPREIPGIFTGVKNILGSVRSGRWKQLTVKDALLNILVLVEVGCWFYVGECIGRRHVVGYDVDLYPEDFLRIIEEE